MNRKKWTALIAIAIVSILLMIISPIIIHCASPNVSSEITADGLLAYMGSCVAAIPTILIAIIAIWQTNKANKIAEEANTGASESDKISIKANEIAEEAIKLTELANQQTDQANLISEKAYMASEKANTISEKLLELEESRQRLDLRPSFAITKWRAPIKQFEEICLCPDGFNIQVGEYSDGIAWGIELEILNTSAGFESICFNKSQSKDGTKKWINAMTGMSTRRIELPPLETKHVFFYADKEFWEKQLKTIFEVDFYINNRIDTSYREKFELLILSMDEKAPHRENEVYLYLEIQNYNVGKTVDIGAAYPEGVIWEK